MHDLVDFVSEEAEIAGKSAAQFVASGSVKGETVYVTNGQNVSYVVPQRIDKDVSGNVKLFFRVTNTFRNCTITVQSGERILLKKKKAIVLPGEMETVLLTESKIAESVENIQISVEEQV